MNNGKTFFLQKAHPHTAPSEETQHSLHNNKYDEKFLMPFCYKCVGRTITTLAATKTKDNKWMCTQIFDLCEKSFPHRQCYWRNSSASFRLANNSNSITVVVLTFISCHAINASTTAKTTKSISIELKTGKQKNAVHQCESFEWNWLKKWFITTLASAFAFFSICYEKR